MVRWIPCIYRTICGGWWPQRCRPLSPLEALKAQAVAARTYGQIRLDGGGAHPAGQVCDHSGCCQAYLDRAERLSLWPAEEATAYQEKISQAVSETDGLYVLYDGEPIDAVFFSSAGGRTVDAQEVWGSATPYLVGVESPEGADVPNYHSEAQFSPEEVRELLGKHYPRAVLPDDPATWFSGRVENSAGGVAQMEVGGITLTGSQLRSLFSLRSSTFTLDYQEGSFHFSVMGYGHGVGLSQYGAKALAEGALAFDQILTWYYTGVEVAGLG